MKYGPLSRELPAAFLKVCNGSIQLLELFDHLHDVMAWAKDEKHRFLWVNTALLVNFGIRSRAEIIGQTDDRIIHPVMSPHYRLDDESVLKGQSVIGRVELVGRFQHNAQWWTTTKIPLRNRRGRIVGTVGIAYPLDNPTRLTAEQAPLGPALRLIGEHYAKPLGNRALATACGLSVRAFERQFRACYRTSPHQYLQQLRLRMSFDALIYSKKSLAALAIEFGFADQSHFTREFRRFFGETPSVYRSRYSKLGGRR